jgi:hypothetical protein
MRAARRQRGDNDKNDTNPDPHLKGEAPGPIMAAVNDAVGIRVGVEDIGDGCDDEHVRGLCRGGAVRAFVGSVVGPGAPRCERSWDLLLGLRSDWVPVTQ